MLIPLALSSRALIMPFAEVGGFRAIAHTWYNLTSNPEWHCRHQHGERQWQIYQVLTRGSVSIKVWSWRMHTTQLVCGCATLWAIMLSSHNLWRAAPAVGLPAAAPDISHTPSFQRGV